MSLTKSLQERSSYCYLDSQLKFPHQYFAGLALHHQLFGRRMHTCDGRGEGSLLPTYRCRHLQRNTLHMITTAVSISKNQEAIDWVSVSFSRPFPHQIQAGWNTT